MTLRVVPKSPFSLRTVATVQRVRILALLAGPPLTVAEIAREVGLRTAAVHRHLRQLVAAGTLTVEGHDGEERRYRRLEPAPMWVTDDDEERLSALLAFATDVHRRWAGADTSTAGVTFDGEMWLDPQVWGRACEQVAGAVEALREAARPPHAPGTVRVSVTARFFGMLEG